VADSAAGQAAEVADDVVLDDPIALGAVDQGNAAGAVNGPILDDLVIGDQDILVVVKHPHRARHGRLEP